MIKSLARRRLKEDDGIVALLTLLFIMTVGTVMLFLLWGISYTSGAYTTLYGAAQSAAYASASEIDFNAENAGETGFAQPPFACQSGFNSAAYGGSTHCTGGKTATAATELLHSALTGQYGLTYPGTVQLEDENGNPMTGVLAYEVGLAPGAAYAADRSCVGFLQSGSSSDLTRTCWQNPIVPSSAAAEVVYPNYVSGVVVVVTADVPFIPHCTAHTSILGFDLNLCPIEHLKVAVAARSGQQIPFSGTNTP